MGFFSPPVVSQVNSALRNRDAESLVELLAIAKVSGWLVFETW
jgi:hypothetical protein